MATRRLAPNKKKTHPTQKSPASKKDKKTTSKSKRPSLLNPDDFNIATSSLHALSNSMTLARNEAKQSPHSSPRLPRRAPNPSAPVLTSSNDTYAGGPSSLQSTGSGSTCSSSGSSTNSSSSSSSASSSAPSAPPAGQAASAGSTSSMAAAAAAPLVTSPAALAAAAAASAPPMVATVSHTVNGNLATHTNISLSGGGNNHVCTAGASGSGQVNNLVKCNKSSSSSILSQTQTPTGSGGSSGVTPAQQNRLSAPASSSAATPSGGGVPSGYVLYKALNKALSSDSPSSSSLESIYQQQHHHLMRQNTTTPPPLPPRKSSPGILTSASDASRHKVAAPRTQQTSAAAGQLLVSRNQNQNQINSASSLCNLSHQVATSLNLSRSSENLSSSSANHVPKNKAPPVPKHQNLDPATLSSCPCQTPTKPPDLKPEPDLDKVIVGPAETIVGIIDTRPLEARQPIILKVDDKADQNLVLTSTSNVYQFKPTSISTSLNGILSNEVTAIFQPVIHQVPNPPQPHHTPKQPQPQPRHQHQQQQSTPPSQASNLHQRHQSLPANNAPLKAPSKSITTSQLSAALSTIANSAKPANPLLYENVNLTLKECNGTSPHSSSTSSATNNNNHLNSSAVAAAMAAAAAASSSAGATSSSSAANNNHHQHTNVPYENINLEYIARLMQEGYSKENVITALGISRNNIEMACDILHEFVTKSGGAAGGGGGVGGVGGGASLG